MEEAIKNRPAVARALLFISLCSSSPNASYLEQMECHVKEALDDVYATGLMDGRQGIIDVETMGW